MRVLLVRLSSIGDVVHTLPALAALARAGHEAGWLVEPASRVLLDGQPLLAQVAPVPAAKAFRLGVARETVRALRARRYDVALDFQGLWKSAAWARLSGARRVVGFAGPWRRESPSALLVGERVERAVVELAALPFAILNPGGGWASKLWPAESFGAVARGLRERGLSAVVTWGPGEEALADRVVAASAGAAVRSFATSLLDYVALARRARLVVAADTGTLHLACAVGTPVVALIEKGTISGAIAKSVFDVLRRRKRDALLRAIKGHAAVPPARRAPRSPHRAYRA